MKTIIFDGKVAAQSRLQIVKKRVGQLTREHGSLAVASIFFEEDPGSVLYTKLKGYVALSAGFAFRPYRFSIAHSDSALIQACLEEVQADPAVAGVIIQKPTEAVWQQAYRGEFLFHEWWRTLTDFLLFEKDIDCLSMARLQQLQTGTSTIIPATVKAVLLILETALGKQLLSDGGRAHNLSGISASVVGCSDIVGAPLADVLEASGAAVTRHCGITDQAALATAAIVVSATGQPDSIRGEMIQPGANVIDVGAPRGDVHFASMVGRARFLTPVPGGVGPMTIVSLLENTLAAAELRVPGPIS